MRKIAIDCRCLKSNGGVSRYLQNILENILVLDKVNKYYLLSPTENKKIEQFSNLNNVEIVYFNTENDIYYKLFLINSFLKKNKINIFWSPTQDSIFFKIRNCKFFLSVHDIAFERFPEWFSYKIRLLSSLGIYRYFFNISDFIFYDSNFTKNDTEKKYGFGKNSLVTYLGATSLFKTLEKDKSRKYVNANFGFKGRYIFYLDTVRFEPLFNAFRIFLNSHPDLYLVCLGNFEGKNIMLKAETLGIKDNLIWIRERIDDSILNNLYSGAEFFISPSFYEGFGLTPLESLQCGTPIIISNTTSLPEIYEDAALYVDPTDSEDIAKKMLILLEDQEIQNNILTKSQKLLNKYDWRDISLKIIDSFNSINLQNKDNAEKSKSIFLRYINFINKYISIKGKKILDIGCARGVFQETLTELYGSNFDMYSIDINEEAVNILKKNNYNVEVYNLDFEEKFPFSDTIFDVIFMFDVIEHLNNFNSLEKLFENNLSKGGYLILTTPNADAAQRFITPETYTGEFDPTHKILFTSYTLDFFLRRKGFQKIINFTPYIFLFNLNFFNQYFLYGGQIFIIYKKK